MDLLFDKNLHFQSKSRDTSEAQQRAVTINMPMMPITGEIYIQVGVHWLWVGGPSRVLRLRICKMFTVAAAHSERDAL